MKFLLILVPLALFGVFIFVQPGKGESTNQVETGKNINHEIGYLIEPVVHQNSAIPATSPGESNLDVSNGNAILTEFNVSEQFVNQEFDFPEREFPDAPSYYSSANGPE